MPVGEIFLTLHIFLLGVRLYPSREHSQLSLIPPTNIGPPAAGDRESILHRSGVPIFRWRGWRRFAGGSSPARVKPPCLIFENARDARPPLRHLRVDQLQGIYVRREDRRLFSVQAKAGCRTPMIPAGYVFSPLDAGEDFRIRPDGRRMSARDRSDRCDGRPIRGF